MKKNQFSKWLQNKTVLAALLIVLMAGTAVAGIMAMKSKDNQEKTEKGQSGYAFQTQEETENDRQQLEVPTETSLDSMKPGPEIAQNPAETKEQPVQSGDVDAVLPKKDTNGKKDNPKDDGKNEEKNGEEEDGGEETEEETLVDAEDAVVYEPETGEQPVGAEGAALLFQEGSHIAWPLQGNVILDYSMDSTIYFPTLKQYKCNPGILIQSEVGQPVEAAVRGMVKTVGSNEEIGNFVVMDLGGEYSIVYGQLKDVTVAPDQVVEAGEVLGYVAEPTKYYVVEGPNMYLEMRYKEDPVDPLDYIR